MMCIYDGRITHLNPDTLKILPFLIMLVLSVNSILASTLNHQRMTDMNNEVGDDVLVICTGSQVKLISAYAYLELGQIIELSQDTPINPDLNLALLECPVDSHTSPSVFAFTNIHSISTLSAFQSVAIAVFFLEYARTPFASLQYSRGPPSYN